MLTFTYAILKIIICSVILYGYYFIALRNKAFHKWNRFYLLAAVVLSLAVPLIKINVWQKADEPKTQVIHFFQVVTTNEEIIYEYTKSKNLFNINTADIPGFLYVLISGIFLAFFIRTLYKIYRLKNKYQKTVLEGINFINTDADGTPFSFFNNIFWNDKIDVNTPTGKQIFQHELAHVKEKHSHDKIFINLILIFFWCNPLFWIIRKELNMIHEFIADKKALEDSDSNAFATMILQATYPKQHFNIVNNFFYSPLKRRLIMLTKNKNVKMSYRSRLLVLPLAAFVFFAFTIKMKTIDTLNHYPGKKITVVIDAGHGGDDGGAKSEDGIYEKDLTLSIAKKIKQINNNANLNIVLLRDDDKNISLLQRVEIAKTWHPDLFISIHIDAEKNKNTNSGLGVLIPTDDNRYLQESKLLGSDIIESFRNNYQLPVANNLKQYDKALVLKANEWPAVLIEAGLLTTTRDLKYLTTLENQHTIAKNILNGIEKYAQQNLLVTEIKDATRAHDFPIFARLEGNAVFNDKINKVTGTADTIIIHSNDKQVNTNMHAEATHAIILKEADTPNAPIYFVDGKEISEDKMKQISPYEFQSLNVLKGEIAIKKYGNIGKDGVIEITTKGKQ
ncbi:MAG: N-acetylmuramoyl-L-alanine amidase [Ginsengibacter sp.]